MDGEKNRTLHLFTAEFPFGFKSEPFLETEILYLSKTFESVIIYPSSVHEHQRSIPKNCQLNLGLSGLDGRIRFKDVFYVNAYAPIFSELIHKGFKTVFRNLKPLLSISITQAKKYAYLKKAGALNRVDIFYDYWFYNSTVCLSIAKRKNQIQHFVSRAHGFDLYDERWPGTGVPFRNYVLSSIVKVYCISKMGQNYLNEKSSYKFQNKILLSYLGTKQLDVKYTSIAKGEITIVSCSSLLPLKKVERIPDLLRSTKHKIHWIHIGDGSTMDLLLANCTSLPNNIRYSLKGHLKNHEILDFYSTQEINGFISLSVSEGLPVSMMEAISAGIPIFSHNTGGISEIVKDSVSGILFSDESEMYQKFDFFLTFPWDSKKIQSLHYEQFNAERNYTLFVNELCGKN